MNLTELDALARRSGLRPKRLGLISGARARHLPAASVVACVAIIAAIVAGILSTVMHLTAATNSRDHVVERFAAQACAARWPLTTPLYVEHDGLSSTVACGHAADRVVLGRVEVADP